MSKSDSDSDTPADINELGLPSINNNIEEDDIDGTNEEMKGVDVQVAGEVRDSKQNEKFNKFRSKAKDLISKTERPKQMYLHNTGITKLQDETPTSGSSSSARPKELEINDPRFNYDVIMSKGYKLLKKMGNGAYASVFL